ncbi:MAG: hypothetical protein RL095_2737 [Verrucomicrobiota bacterium]|jgi:hypothetical protein
MFTPLNRSFASPARKFLARLLLAASILHAGGFDLMLLQGFAWAKMTVEYSRDHGLQEGLERTFDGEHPCELCCAIRKQEAERQAAALPDLGPKKRLPARLQLFSLPEAPRLVSASFSAPLPRPGLLPEAPDSPPPISA